MNIARSATRFLPILTVASATTLFSPSVWAAPPINSAALSFRLMARVGYRAPGESASPSQTIEAKVWLKGNQARVETPIGGEPAVLLLSPTTVYRLLPSAKAGVKYTVPARKSAALRFEPQELLQNPAKIRAALVQSGAKKVGASTLYGSAVEVYQASNFRQKGQTAKVWIRKSDALPARFELTGGSLSVAASWRDYQKPKSLASSLFAPPAGYKIRAAKGAPPFSVF